MVGVRKSAYFIYFKLVRQVRVVHGLVGASDMEPSIQEEEFTPVTYKKVRAPKKRKGREKPRERSLVERLALRRDLLQQSGFLKQCQGQWDWSPGGFVAVDCAPLF